MTTVADNPMGTIAILRGLLRGDAIRTARSCWNVGFDLVEVSVRVSRDWEALEGVVEASEGRTVGAGTVRTAEAAVRAVDAGAQVLISPGFDRETIQAAARRQVPIVPGVMTPTELDAALRAGVRTCKLFPAGELGVAYLRALLGPFPEARLVAVGGIDAGNAEAFMRAGARGVAFGGSLDQILALPDPASYLDGLRRLVPREPSERSERGPGEE